MGKVMFGSKYEFKADRNPPVGGYDVDSGSKFLSFRNRSIVPFNKSVSSPKKQSRNPYGTHDLPTGPDPGEYQKEVVTFGTEIKSKVTIGKPYPFVADSNPAVGQYDPDTARELVSSRSRTALITKEVSPWRRPQH